MCLDGTIIFRRDITVSYLAAHGFSDEFFLKNSLRKRKETLWKN